MGGGNSGRRPGFGIRETLEDLGACELRVGLAMRLCQAGVISAYSWSVAGKVLSSVTLQRTGHAPYGSLIFCVALLPGLQQSAAPFG